MANTFLRQVTVAAANAGVDFGSQRVVPQGFVHTGGGTITFVDGLGASRTMNVDAGRAYPLVAGIASITACTGDGYVQFFEDAGKLPTPQIAAPTSATGVLELELGGFYLATGAPLAVFSGGASAVPGMSLTDSEAVCIRWNNNATLNAIMTKKAWPADMDLTEDATVYIHASKTGATVGDAVTFDLAVFNQVVGALHDADADFGGTTDAMDGDATAKTIQSVSRDLAAANLAAAPASFSLTLKPTDGTLGTDDLLVHRVFIEYAKKS